METRDLSPETTARTSRPRQFRLWHLFLGTFVVAIMCAVVAQFGRLGVAAVIAFAGVVLIIGLKVRGKTNLVESLVLVGIVGFLVALLLPAVQTGSTSAKWSGCRANLKQIGLALRGYHDRHGSFPPAYVADGNGKPMHSWRVLILPYIGRPDLYDAYDFDESWDGPNNTLLHNVVVELYNCPCEFGQPNASYLAIVGEGAAWTGAKGRTLEEIAQVDGITSTILLVETHNSGIHWMEPRDLDFATMATTINQGPPGRCISSHHGAGANVAMADGSVHFLPDTISGKTVQSLVTIDGGEIVNPDDF